jgi:GR25 family glycosyltransferase involved in LPS biosynthesis
MRINDYFDKVVVINLDKRTDRLEKISKQLDELGITFERFSAIDGKAEGIDPITAGTMSHQKVLEENVEKRILILEDDAQFVDDFNEKFNEVIQYLPGDTDIFYLGALLPKSTGKVEDIGNKYWFKQIFSTGSHAYSIHPARVKYFAEKLKDYEWYIDIGLREFARDYKAVIAQPNLVTQYPSYSDLRLKEVSDF